MRYLAAAVAIFFAFLIQFKVSILSVQPNLVAVLAYYAGITRGEYRGLAAGLVLGAIEDSIASTIIGPNMLGKGLVGFLSSFFISGGMLVWTPLLGVIGLFGLTLLDNAVVFMSLGIFEHVPANISTAIFISLMQAILNSAAGTFIKPRHAD
jgi:rod shape-determining protein MreD